jgi:4-amino-4-deoxy-L-arabinose transferase-like glycosyltransferase
MNRLKDHSSNIWEILFIILGVLLVLAPSNPLNMPYTDRDSGFFLYSGWRVLSGETPYLDFWDHKPPAIFFINALGLALPGNSRWGVWFLELLFLIAACWMGYQLIKKSFGVIPAGLSMMMSFIGMNTVIGGGNLTTEYALPFQFALLWLAHRSFRDGFRNWHSILIGVLSGLVFCIKQNAIGVSVTILVLLFFYGVRSGRSDWVKHLLLIAVGGLSILAGVAVYFVTQGALAEMWEAAFIYNFVYSDTVFSLRVRGMAEVSNQLSIAWLFPLAVIGFIIGWISRKNEKGQSQTYALEWLAIVNFPIELILVGISGKSYPHYYISLVPVSVILAGYAIKFILTEMQTKWRVDKFQKVFLLLPIGFLIFFNFFNYLDTFRAFSRLDRQKIIISYIQKNTAKDDFVLLYGAEASINFFAVRRSPSRYVYQYPLYQENYVNEAMIIEFLSDIERNPPKLIIDTYNPLTPIFEFPIVSDEISDRVAKIWSLYSSIGPVGGWRVYERVEP